MRRCITQGWSKAYMKVSTGYSEVDEILQNYMEQCQTTFPDKIRAIYLLGSLAYGGFIPGWSDIDGIIVLKCAVTKGLHDKYKEIIERLEKFFPRWKRKLFIDQLLSETELYSTDIYSSDLGLVNLVSLLETGKLIYGKDVRSKIKPPPKELLNRYMIKELIEKILEYRADRLPLTADISEKDEEIYRDNPSHIIAWLFYPTRTLYTLETSKIRSKEEAVRHYISKHKDEYVEFLSKGLEYRKKGVNKIPENEFWPFIKITSRFFWHYVNLLLRYYGMIDEDHSPINERSLAIRLLKQAL